jgi:hypothetical protein
VLFIEKEGFMPLFERVHLAERYEIADMSTKGMSVTAARLSRLWLQDHRPMPIGPQGHAGTPATRYGGWHPAQ